MNILIADDGENSRLELENTLRTGGFTVTSTTDGSAALECATNQPPDLIISDIMMPNMDGFELCRRLKKNPRLAPIPIVLYTTSFLEDQDRQLAQALGVARLVSKPQEPQKLREIICQVLAASPSLSVIDELSLTAPRLHIDEMYVRCVGRKLDQKVEELEVERAAVQKSEEKFRTIFNAVNEVIFIHDAATGAILDTNQTFTRMYGYSADELNDLTVEQLSSGEPPFTQREAMLLMKKTIAGTTQVFDWHSKHKSGRLFWTGVNMSRATIGSDVRIIVVVRDISARKQAERQRLELEAKLHQKYKMEAIGVMAGGIAHDFNNKLAIILGNIEYAQLKVEPYSDIAAPLGNAKTATLRARDLVNQILKYSRKGNHVLIPINLVTIMAETVRLMRSTIATTIDIEADMGASAVTISGDTTQIQEVIINLCNNAVHAMHGSGQIQLKLETVVADKITIPTQYEGERSSFAKISIIDNGSGIEPSIIEKIFDPFFTTKQVPEGTGMGLAVVQGIMDSHHGFLQLNSIVGTGTTFELFFPAISQIQKNTSVKLAALKPLSGGNESILVVDDEDKLVRIISRLLGEYGYQVTTLTSSVQALERVQTKPDEFDMVITDQSMPELSGRDLVEKLLKIRADLPIILCTGYSSKVDEDKARSIGVKAFCLKPLNLDQLVQTTRRVLDGEVLID